MPAEFNAASAFLWNLQYWCYQSHLQLVFFSDSLLGNLSVPSQWAKEVNISEAYFVYLLDIFHSVPGFSCWSNWKSSCPNLCVSLWTGPVRLFICCFIFLLGLSFLRVLHLLLPFSSFTKAPWHLYEQPSFIHRKLVLMHFLRGWVGGRGAFPEVLFLVGWCLYAWLQDEWVGNAWKVKGNLIYFLSAIWLSDFFFFNIWWEIKFR